MKVDQPSPQGQQTKGLKCSTSEFEAAVGLWQQDLSFFFLPGDQGVAWQEAIQGTKIVWKFQVQQKIKVADMYICCLL